MSDMISDRILMAYVDGELDPAQRAGVEQAAARDPVMAERLKAHAALRARVAETFANIADQPVPEALRALVGEDESVGALVIDFAAARTARAQKRRAAWPVVGAMAACLAAGLVLGVGLDTLRPGPAIAGQGGVLVARGVLATALGDQLASRRTPGEPVRIGVSFRTPGGEYCRTFRIDQGRAIAGLACREPGEWLVKMAVSAAPQSPASGYRTAASETPAVVMAMVESLSAGAPLDAQDEAKARARGWRP